MNIRPATSVELESIETTRRAYRDMWTSPRFKDLPPCPFIGTREDIDALDFIDYELGGDHPKDLAGAALLWGGVLAATGVLSWAVADEQHLVLVGDPIYPRVLILPYARVEEINQSSVPQYGKYEWLLVDVVQCLMYSGFGPDAEEKLLALLSVDSGEFVESARRSLDLVTSRVDQLARRRK